jgi:hypothetical protein
VPYLLFEDILEKVINQLHRKFLLSQPSETEAEIVCFSKTLCHISHTKEHAVMNLTFGAQFTYWWVADSLSCKMQVAGT